MGFFDRFFSRKVSQARQVISHQDIGKAITTPRNYEAFAREAYLANVIAYKAISTIARNAASIDWILYQKNSRGDKIQIEQNPLLDVLEQPNPLQSGTAFFESAYAYYMLAGNSYIEGVKATGDQYYEMWAIRPDKIVIVPSANGTPAKYIFKFGPKEAEFEVDAVTGKSDLLHVKTFHPINPWYGLSPVEPAIYGIDQHNESSKWNVALLQNEAKPSGILSVQVSDSNPSGTLPEPVRENLRNEVNKKHAGAPNAGRIMLMEGGLDWKQLGLSPKDMDWMQGKNASARDIALAFGMPPLLLNIPGDSTYSNYKEARLALYEETIIPMVDLMRDELNKWLVPAYGDNLMLDYDADSIEALASKRAEKFTQMQTSTFLTINEKREGVGYSPVEGGDVLLVNSGQVPITDLEQSPDEDIEETPQDGNTENTDNVNDEDAEEQDSQDDSNGNSDDMDDESDDNAKSIHKKGLLVNSLSSKGKQRSWRQVNAIRNKLKQSMYLDVKEYFEDLAKDIGRATQTTDARLAEFGALKVIGDNTKKLETILEKHILRTAKLFGNEVIQSGKSYSPIEEVKISSQFNQAVIAYSKRRSLESGAIIDGTSIKVARKKIRDIVTEGLAEGSTADEVANNIQKEFDSLSTSRAQTIAKTEIGSASSMGSLEAAKSLDVPDLKKVWISVQDDRTRDGESKLEADHLDMNETAVDLDDKFSVPVNGDSDTQMEGPGDPSAGANQIVNCRCVLVYERRGKFIGLDYSTQMLGDLE